jgi:hypothetical protein
MDFVQKFDLANIVPITNCVIVGPDVELPDPGARGVVRIGNARAFLEIDGEGRLTLHGTDADLPEAIADGVMAALQHARLQGWGG